MQLDLSACLSNLSRTLKLNEKIPITLIEINVKQRRITIDVADAEDALTLAEDEQFLAIGKELNVVLTVQGIIFRSF